MARLLGHIDGGCGLGLVAVFPDYAGRHAVVTGCYSGIGRAVAQMLLDSGASVHGLDLCESDLELDRFTFLDLRDPDAVAAAAESVDGPVDALFNCAGVPPGRHPLDVLTINFIATRELTGHIAGRMQAGGAIANVASNGGMGWQARLPQLRELVATPTFAAAQDWCASSPDVARAAYSVSKEAIILWTMAGASDMIRRGIRMNAISPGAVQTSMLDVIEQVTPRETIDQMAQPIGRRSSPQEQAGPLLFLNSPLASYVNGAVLQVDGGFFGARMTGTAPAAPVGRR